MSHKLNRFVILLCLLVVFGAAGAAYAQDGQIVGGYGETSPDDKGVVAAARFAVKKRGQNTRTTVKLLSIKSAKVQVVAGLNYQVCLQISYRNRTGRTVRQFVQAVVYRNLRGFHSLTSWTPLKNSSGC